MGTKVIWDGEQLPPIGCEVLIHLASPNAWVRHIVSDYNVQPTNEKAHHRIFVVVKQSDHDPGSSSNQRLLCDVKPLDWRGDIEVNQ